MFWEICVTQKLISAFCISATSSKHRKLCSRNKNAAHGSAIDIFQNGKIIARDQKTQDSDRLNCLPTNRTTTGPETQLRTFASSPDP